MFPLSEYFRMPHFKYFNFKFLITQIPLKMNLFIKISARRNRLSSDSLEDVVFLYEIEDISYGISNDDDDEIEFLEEEDI